MSARIFISKLHEALAGVAKDIAPDGMLAGGPSEGAAGANTPAAQPTASAVEQLADVAQRLAALLQKAGQTGQLPDGADAEVKTLAGIMLAMVGGGTEEAAPSPEGGTESAEKRWIIKALAPEVELAATVNYVADQIYKVSSLLRGYDNPSGDRTPNVAGAKALLVKLTQVLSTMPDGAAAGGEGDVSMSQEKQAVAFKSAEEFASWSSGQLEALKADEPVVAAKRLTNLAAAVKVAKLAFEQTSPEPKGPLTIEMETAFAAGGVPGTAMDLTTKPDQESSGGGTGAPSTDTGEPSAAHYSSNGAPSSLGGQPNASAIAEQITAFVRSNTPNPGTPVAAASGGATATSKRDEGEFVWPMDLADFPRDEDGARVRTTKKDDALPKGASRTSVAKGAGHDDGWGKDPWTKRA